jgi:nitroreductase
LIDLANLSPSSFNLQPWKVIVVRNPEKKRVLRECAFHQPKIEEAPVVLIIIADLKAVEENMEKALNSWQELGYIKSDERDTYIGMINNLYGETESLKRKLFAVKNASLFAMNLMIAAKVLDFDTHPMDGFEEDKIKKEFNIPEDEIIPMLIAVGNLKPEIILLKRAFRRSFEEFVIFENV